MEYLYEFSSDIAFEILSYLNQYELLRLQLLSKFYKDLVHKFIEKFGKILVRNELNRLYESNFHYQEMNDYSKANIFELYSLINHVSEQSKPNLEIANNLQRYMHKSGHIPEAMLLFTQLIARTNPKYLDKNFSEKTKNAICYASYFYTLNTDNNLNKITLMSLYMKIIRLHFGNNLYWDFIKEYESKNIEDENLLGEINIFLNYYNLNNTEVRKLLENVELSMEEICNTLGVRYYNIYTNFASPNLLDFLNVLRRYNIDTFLKFIDEERFECLLQNVSNNDLRLVYKTYKNNFLMELLGMGEDFTLSFLNFSFMRTKLRDAATKRESLKQLYDDFYVSHLLPIANNLIDTLHQYISDEVNYLESSKDQSSDFSDNEENSYTQSLMDKYTQSYITETLTADLETLDQVQDRINSIIQLSEFFNICAVTDWYKNSDLRIDAENITKIYNLFSKYSLKVLKREEAFFVLGALHPNHHKLFEIIGRFFGNDIKITNDIKLLLNFYNAYNNLIMSAKENNNNYLAVEEDFESFLTKTLQNYASTFFNIENHIIINTIALCKVKFLHTRKSPLSIDSLINEATEEEDLKPYTNFTYPMIFKKRKYSEEEESTAKKHKPNEDEDYSDDSSNSVC